MTKLVKTEIGGEICDKVGLVKTEIGGEICDKVGLVKTEIGGKIDDKVSQVKTEIGEVIEGKVNEVVATINEDIKNKAWLVDILEGKIKKRNFYLTKETDNELRDIGINYFIFNETFGGNVNEIKCLEEQFLEFFTECKNVLDIGSGRGVFLELLREKGIKGYGIDSNDDLILYCQKKGLNVQKDDALSHFKKLNSKSVDGVFMAHVIEHLRQEEIVHLISLCHEKMQYGSYIVIVTPNILSVSVSANSFYMDPTHVTHVHPEVIKFLLRSCGYRDIQERFYPAIPDEYKLKKIEFCDTSNTEEQKKFLEIMNHNIDMLNNLLFGNRDYAVIAKK
jgi:O-antigen chain-terminating methyltransferase